MLVTGAGILGLTVAAMAAESGAEVIVSDPDAARRELARRFGAVPVDPAARAGSSERLDTTLAAFERRGFSEVLVAVEASGAPSAVGTVVDVLGVGGVAVLVGSVPSGSAVYLDAESLGRRHITITSVRDSTGEQLRRAVAFLERTWRLFPFDELVGATHPLAALDDALAEAATGAYVRVGVAPGRRPV